MKTGTKIISILLGFIFASCNSHWIITEVDGKYIWKKEKPPPISSYLSFSPEIAKANTLQWDSIFVENEYMIFETDSVRIYIQREDSILKLLTSKGFIQGKYLFNSNESNTYSSGFPKRGANTKVTKNNWTGYQFYLSNLFEISFEMIPRELRNLILGKSFKVDVSHWDQENIEPVKYQLDMTNSHYTMKQQDIGLKEFITTADNEFRIYKRIRKN